MPASLERTMNGDNTITGAKSAQRARNKELSKIDQIRGLELAVMEYKKDANDKNWSTIDKILQALAKMTNVKLFCSCPTLLMDLQWVLTVNVENRRRSKRAPGDSNSTGDEGQNSLVTTALNLLTKLCSTDISVAVFLRDKLRMHLTLTDLLILVPITNHLKCGKILDLLRHITFDMKLQRQESFLQDLITRLFQHINDKDENHKNISLSLTILTSLCHANYSITTFVLSLISYDERKALIAKHNEDPVLQVLLLRFNFCLSQANLSGQISTEINIGYYVTQILDAVCQVYSEEDCLLLQTFCDFLKDLGNETRYRKDLEHSIKLEFIQQLFLVQDCSQGCNRANELIFRFAREAVPLYAGDIHLLLELVVRTVTARLEQNQSISKPATFTDCCEGILLLDSVIREALNKMNAIKRESSEVMSGSQIQNIKLQLDQITPMLCSIFESSLLHEPNSVTDVDVIDVLDQMANTFKAVLSTLSTIGSKEEWVEMIVKQLKNPSELIGQIKYVIDRNINTVKQSNSMDPRHTLYSKCLSPIITELIKLSVLLSCYHQGWSDACYRLISDDMLISDIHICMKKGCHMENIGALLVSLPTGKPTGKLMEVFTSSLTARSKQIANSYYDNSIESINHDQNFVTSQSTIKMETMSNYMPPAQDDIKIGEVMATVTQACANSQVDETLADIFDLNEYRLMAHKRQIESLKSSLKSADQRISEAGLINVHLESEVTKLNNITKNLLRKLEVTEKQLREIKNQYHSSQDDNTEFRQNLLKDLEEKTKSLDSLEEEKKRYTDKIIQYKDRMIAMKARIEELESTETILNKNLEEEVKQKNDLQATLAKREEKLKKKDKIIQDDIDERENREKELDNIKKELASLKQLTKRQEQAIQKKDKQLQDQSEEMNGLKTLQEQIFNLSKKAKV